MYRKAMLWEKLAGGKVKCALCAHRCEIAEGAFGFCGVRKNIKGELVTLVYGRIIANHVDPIEKKPLYHFLPGSSAYSIATIGCNFRCGFCQNWTISQLTATGGDVEGSELAPEEVVREAKKAGCKSISYTYTEPTIFFEYAFDTAKIAKEKGLFNNFVTNGFMTEEAIEKIHTFLDAANIDLKFFNDGSYKRICKGRLEPVLDSIRRMKKLGIWVEVTTLVVPGENDSEKEFRSLAEFLVSVGSEIPWHISRFHPDYKYTGLHSTPVETLEKAAAIGKSAGLKYIYLGNVPEGNDTICPGCGKVLIERAGFSAKLTKYFSQEGKCANCGYK
ncbi:MAG: AmmeMemoRadiSam system radical SAM enzyme, partial [Candidatus Omnitrophica bacterium]|nr:AmmeMemoRadiSam system radical SAM enzyme [Candidatus Omnitrophota bacterium]